LTKGRKKNRPMGNIAHLSYLGKYLKIFFSFYVHFIFFCSHNKRFHVTYKGGHCLRTQQACICDIEWGSRQIWR
jgi:hypothetical protein